MHITRTRSLAALAAGSLLAVTLVGCGGSEDAEPASKPSATSSASAEPSDGPDGAAAEAPEEYEGTEIDPAAFIKDVVGKMRAQKTAHMVIEIGSSMTADADVSYGADTAMRMTMTTGGQTMEAIMLGRTMYLKSGPNQKYTKIDENTPGAGAVLGQFKSLGPQQSLDDIKGAVKKVVEVGEEKVDGEQMTKYALTVDTSAVVKQLGQAVAGADLPQTVNYLMFVDDDGLLRRISMTVSGQKVVMKVSDWGKPFSVKAPPASQVAKSGATP